MTTSAIISEAARLRREHPEYSPDDAMAMAELMALMSGPHYVLICADEFEMMDRKRP